VLTGQGSEDGATANRFRATYTRYTREHLPMGRENLVGATGIATYRILGSPAGRSPFARLSEVSFPTSKAPQECAALPGAQKTLENAVEISTGGAPHFMLVEQEG
jgi:hypothetical protein